MRRGAAGLLLGIVVMLAGAQPASSASCWFGCSTPTPKPPVNGPTPTVPAPAPAPAPAAAPFDPATAQQRILELTNAERAAVGLPGLSMRADVTDIAQGQSDAMAAAGTIWHNEQFLTQATRKALAANMLGENVGVGGTVDQVHAALMNSPGHKANNLEPAFSIVGMAVAMGADGMVYVTQDFVQPSGGTPVAVKAVSKPRVAAAPKAASPRPKVASAPSPKPTAAPATTAPPTTEAPATTTSTVAAQPDSSVLAAFDSAPQPAPQPAGHASGTNGLELLVAFVLVAASATGVVRVRVTRRA
jgi:uncharacterized protein YkwD